LSPLFVAVVCRVGLSNGCRFVHVDLADAAASLLAEGFDGVLHFAASGTDVARLAVSGRHASASITGNCPQASKLSTGAIRSPEIVGAGG
jgi:hypothetical protein